MVYLAQLVAWLRLFRMIKYDFYDCTKLSKLQHLYLYDDTHVTIQIEEFCIIKYSKPKSISIILMLDMLIEKLKSFSYPIDLPNCHQMLE